MLQFLEKGYVIEREERHGRKYNISLLQRGDIS